MHWAQSESAAARSAGYSPDPQWNPTIARKPVAPAPALAPPPRIVQMGPVTELSDLDLRVIGSPNDPSLLARRGSLLLRLRRFHGAASDFSDAIRMSPAPTLEYHAKRGQAYDAVGRGKDAAADFQICVGLSRHLDERLLFEALAHEAMGEFDEALRAHNRRFDLKDPSPTPWREPRDVRHDRARCYIRCERFMDAAADLDAVVASAPGNSAVHYDRARVREALGELDGAASDATAVIRLDEYDDAAYAVRARILRKQGKLPAALEDLNAAIRLSPQTGVYYEMRGDLYEAQGKGALAVDDFAKAVELMK
jgi:tetratricopeptide (TPR) repeat protein